MRDTRIPITRRRISIFQFVLIAVVVAKAVLSMVTISPVTENLATELIGGSLVAKSTPWGFMSWVTYQLWLRLPTNNSEILANPNTLRTLTLASSSLLLFLKLPAILLDLLTGLALYRYVKDKSSDTAAKRVLLVWFVNPFTTLSIEMWGSIVILATSMFALTMLAFARRKVLISGLLGALAFSTAPILALAAPALWLNLAQAKRWRTLLLHVAGAMIGLFGYIWWTNNIQQDPFRLLSVDTQYSFGLADFFADPYAYFGAKIGIGASLAIAYAIFSYFLHQEGEWKAIPLAYGIVSILLAFSTSNLTVPLLILPFLSLQMKDDLSKLLPKTSLFLMALLPVLTIIAGASQIFRSGSSIIFIPVAEGSSLDIKRILGETVVIFVLQPFLRAVLLAALLVLSLGAACYNQIQSTSPQGFH